MAWAPDGAPNTIFSRISAAEWHDINHGGSLDIASAPHRQQQPVYAFRVTKKFVDKVGGIQYKVGMQGQLHEVDTKKQQGRIFIQGVTERDDSKHRWVPLRCIEKGKRWETDIKKWSVKIQLQGQYRFDKRNWETASLPDATVLGQTITRFITALLNSPADSMPPKFVEYLEKQHVAVLTNGIIAGIKESGLYEILSSNQPFTVPNLVAASRYRIRDSQSCQKGGVYVTFHKAGQQVGFSWVPQSTYAYVGHTTNFSKRNAGHRSNNSSSYGNLTRNSTNLEMLALCVLPELSDYGLYFLAEQMFVCMLGTYRPQLLNQDNQNISLMGFVEPARYFTAMSKEVFQITGWRGMLQRGASTCGIQYGANCSSPISEYTHKSEKFLFIREDIDIKEGNLTVPMAVYRRSDRHVKTAPTVKTAMVCTKIVENHKWKTFMTICTPFWRTKTAGLDEPPSNWPYELVIEVRKDGSAHPHAWARLPQIGRFKNWEQANSWAVRVEWEYPRGSGTWRVRYVQSWHAWKLADPGVPGSLIHYVKGIAFLQWITGSDPNHRHSWIPRIQGKARVMQCKKDMMNQTFIFRSNQDPIRMLPGDILSDNDIKGLMMKLEYGLRLNVPFGDFGGAAVGHRKYCDTCSLVQRHLFGGGFPDNSCVQDRRNNVCCTTCRHFGRPCCSWTPTLPNIFLWNTLFADQRRTVAKGLSALVRLPIAKIPPKLQSFTQQFRSLEDVVEEDDGDSGDELNDDDEEEDSEEEEADQEMYEVPDTDEEEG